MKCLVLQDPMPGIAHAPAQPTGSAPREARGRMNRTSAPPSPSLPIARVALGIAMLACLFAAPPASALDEGAGEEKAIDACDKRLCSMVQGRDPRGEDLKCVL